MDVGVHGYEPSDVAINKVFPFYEAKAAFAYFESQAQYPRVFRSSCRGDPCAHGQDTGSIERELREAGASEESAPDKRLVYHRVARTGLPHLVGQPSEEDAPPLRSATSGAPAPAATDASELGARWCTACGEAALEMRTPGTYMPIMRAYGDAWAAGLKAGRRGAAGSHHRRDGEQRALDLTPKCASKCTVRETRRACTSEIDLGGRNPLTNLSAAIRDHAAQPEGQERSRRVPGGIRMKGVGKEVGTERRPWAGAGRGRRRVVSATGDAAAVNSGSALEGSEASHEREDSASRYPGPDHADFLLLATPILRLNYSKASVQFCSLHSRDHARKIHRLLDCQGPAAANLASCRPRRSSRPAILPLSRPTSHFLDHASILGGYHKLHISLASIVPPPQYPFRGGAASAVGRRRRIFRIHLEAPRLARYWGRVGLFCPAVLPLSQYLNAIVCTACIASPLDTSSLNLLQSLPFSVRWGATSPVPPVLLRRAWSTYIAS
ncbi:hypothetical protein C8R44DRAFT_855021 [Mycena epipterygia]|nr:hypothetical protein C8R44DRAFT_855021 [Mycena epipterygia]